MRTGTSIVIPVIVMAAIVLGFVLVLVAIIGVAGFIYFRGSSGGAASPSLAFVGINPAVQRAVLDQIEAGMALEDVQKILGAGRSAGSSDILEAFGRDPGAAAQWAGNAASAGVTQWFRWQNGDESIFVGFAKGHRSKKLRVLLTFWVRRFATAPGLHGFESKPGVLASAHFGDPDDYDKERRDFSRLVNDPKWKTGNPRQLLIGRFQDQFKFGYEFWADGRVKCLGPIEFTSTYRFVDDIYIEVMIPGNKLLPPGPNPKPKRYRVLVAEDELVLMDTFPHPIPQRFRRVR